MKNVFKMMGIALVACSMLVACGDDTETFTIKVKANDSSMGTVTGGGKYENGAVATLEATPNAGFTFVEWNDGAKNNPYNVTVTADAEYIATFAAQAGVKVQFGDATWNAESINASHNSTAYMIAAPQSATSQYPFALVYSSSLATGSTTGSPNVNIAEGTASAGDPYMWYFENADRAMTLGGNPCGDWWADNLTVNVSAFDADAMTISLVASGTAKSLFDCLSGATWDNTPSKAMTMTVTNVNLNGSKAMPTVFEGKIAIK